MPDQPLNIDTFAPSDVAAALDAAEDNVEILDTTDDGCVHLVARHTDYAVEPHDLQRYEGQPSRARGTVTALTQDGFIRAVEARHTGTTTIYADEADLHLVAVLNDDTADKPGWRDHRVTYQPRTTPEWQLWMGGQGLRPQDEFAAMIDAGETDIREPSATVMLDIAQTFEASTSAKFKKAGRIKDGKTQLVYEEDIEASAGEGMVTIPDSFTVELRPFYGAEPVMVPCKLRYRLKSGELAIGYHIHRPEEIRRDSFMAVVGAVEADLSGITLVQGLPADPRTGR